MTESIGLHRIRRKGTPGPNAADTDGATTRHDDRTSRAVVVSALAAVVVLVLLLPTTPVVGFLLIAAVSLGVVAALVRRAEDRRSTGESLERLETKGYLVLADRVAPGLAGTIGHLVIGPGGVFVVETRLQTGRVRIRGDQLVVGRLSHSVAAQLHAQVAAVTTAMEPILAGTRARVVPLVCMRYAELPLFSRSVSGIPLLRESQLARRIGRSTPVLDAATVSRLGELADRTMPPTPHRRGAHTATAAGSLVRSSSTDSADEAFERDPLGWSMEPSDHASESLTLAPGMALPSAGS